MGTRKSDKDWVIKVKKRALRILLVEDNPDHEFLLREILNSNDRYAIKLSTASTGPQGLEMIKKDRFNLALVDYKIPGLDGLELLKLMADQNIEIPIIMITGAGDYNVAVQAMKMGAYDYVVKDVAYTDNLNVIINRALERYEIKKEGEELERRLLQKTTELEKANRRLKRLSITDDLTGVHNRRFMFKRFEEECVRTERYPLIYACAIVDLDLFKPVNDKFGHLFGDFVLKKTASILKRNLRRVDILGRYGGDEFMILMPSTNAKNAYALGERIRKKIEVQAFRKEKKSVRITASIGIACCPTENINDKKQLIEAADRALYKAKSDGRNRTELA